MHSADRLARLFLLPLFLFVAAFFLLPMVRLIGVAGSGPNGMAEYVAILTNPRHFATLVATLALSAAVTAATPSAVTVTAAMAAPAASAYSACSCARRPAPMRSV